MGLLDFLNTPQGQALASGVATYAATARRGTPVNNIGRGLLGGVQGYQNAIDAQRQAKIDAQKEAYNNQMMQYNTTQAETARMKAESEMRKLLQKQESERANSKMLMPGFLRTAGFQGQGFDIDESGELVPSEQVVMQPVSANLDFLADAGDEYKAMIAQGLQSPDLAVRKQAMNEAFRYYRDSRKPANTKFTNITFDKDGTPWGVNPATGEFQQIKGGFRKDMTKTPLVDVKVHNVMPGEAAEAAGKKEGFEIGAQAAAIENKYSALDSVREAIEMMSAGIYAGTYGDIQKAIAKGTLGAIGDRQKAINTEKFLSYIGNTVVPRLKEFGGNDSNEEMRYLKSIMGGDTSMEPESIAAILESAERKILRGIERLQRQRGALESGRMPDLGPGPSRIQPKTHAKPGKPTVSNW